MKLSKNATRIKVVRRDGEDIEHLLRRFKKEYQESGIMADAKKKEYYVGPSEKRRLKHEEAVKARKREERLNAIYSSKD